MNHKSMIRAFRKNVMRLGKVTRVEALKRDDDGTLYPKKDRGFCVESTVNGHRISSYGKNSYEAWQGANFCAKWAIEQEPFDANKVFGGEQQ